MKAISYGYFIAALLLLTFCFSSAFTQQQASCGADELTEALLQQLAESRPAPGDHTGVIYRNSTSPSTYIIPTVVHVIHNNGPENISDAQIKEAIDLANSQILDQIGNVDVKIHLELASIDPWGECTNGIVRVQTPAPNLNLPSDFSGQLFAYQAIKNLSRWPSGQYLNVWVVKNFTLSGSPLLGSAFIPIEDFLGSNVFEEQDGVVAVYSSFGNTGAAQNTEYPSAFVHEVGHYLGLCHVWQCPTSPSACHEENEGTTHGDKVSDTEQCSTILFPTDCNSEDNGCNGNDYPKENYMSYAWACHTEFTDGQRARMQLILDDFRAGLWDTQNLACTGTAGYLGSGLEINSNTVWSGTTLPNNGEVLVQGNLTVKAGYELEIREDVTVHFCANSRLIIEPNARLKLAGTLTNSCGGSWKGVEIWGKTNASQYPLGGVYAQGRLEASEDAVIENAEVAVQLWGLDEFNDAGGQIYCNGTIFRNNHIGVKFAPYQNWFPPTQSQLTAQPRGYFANFINCTFEVNEAYSIEEPFLAFLYLRDVEDIKVWGCDFISSRELENAVDIKDYGFGILANDSGFKVRPSCLSAVSPCEDVKPCRFDGLGYGICTENASRSMPYILEQAEFRNCYLGLWNKGVTGATIVLNNFYFGNLPDPEINDGEQLGAFFENGMAGFTFEENRFEQPSGGNAELTIGTYCKNLGVANNEVRKNYYFDVDRGNVAAEINGAQGGLQHPGLHYTCNENYNIREYDFLVENTIDPFGIIRAIQGVIPDPTIFFIIAAGNKFSNTAIADFENLGTPRDYYHDPNLNNLLEVPDLYAGMDLFPADDENLCVSNFCIPPCHDESEVEAKKEEYYDSKENHELAHSHWEEALLSGDSTQAYALEVAMTGYRAQMHRNAYQVVLHEMYDTLTFSRDTLRAWLENMNTYESGLLLAKDYLADGDSLKGMEVFYQLPLKYELAEYQLFDWTELKEIFALLGQKSKYNLNEAAITSLLLIADKPSGYATIMAQNILSLYGYHFPPYYYVSEPGSEQRNAPAAQNESQAKGYVRAYPVPASGFVVLEWKGLSDKPQTVMTIKNLAGQTVWAHPVSSGEGKVQWQGTAGIYFFELAQSGAVLQTGKIVITKN